MEGQPPGNAKPPVDARASWMPLLVLILAQILLVFNLSTLQVSIEGIASSLQRPPTAVGPAIVAYSLVVAGFLMVGARIAERYGARRVCPHLVGFAFVPKGPPSSGLRARRTGGGWPGWR